MSLYAFTLKNMGGCYVGIESATLKDACSIYKHFVKTLNNADNSAVEKIERIKKGEYINAEKTYRP